MSNLYEFELDTGETVKLTLAYGHLYKLKSKRPDDYKTYNAIMAKGVKDEIEGIVILYTGYLCGIIAQGGDLDEAMDFEEFLSVLPVDREDVGNAVGMMIAPKKMKASADHS